jgi:photosynthetic reaction center cytochrome c subunit
MKRTGRIGLLAVGLAMLVVGPVAQSAEAQHSWWSDRAPSDMRVEEFYENIQVMNGMRADLLRPSMSAMEATLGIHCNYCHAPGDNAADTPMKETARRMMRMVRDINNSTFGGRNVVTCATCHTTTPKPALYAPVGQGRQLPAELSAAGQVSEEVPIEGEAPTVTQILDRYLQAIGGAQAVQRITSIAGTGTFRDYGELDYVHTTRMPREPTGLELFVKGQDQRRAVIKQARGDLITVQQADSGWASGGFFGAADLPPREMAPDEVDASKIQNAVVFPMLFSDLVHEMRVVGTATVGGRPATVVLGHTDALPVVKLYFDQGTGMLSNVQYYTENPICCRRVFNIVLTDRQNLGGVQVPRRWILTSDRDTYHEYTFTNLQVNTAVDDALFMMPAAPPPAR